MLLVMIRTKKERQVANRISKQIFYQLYRDSLDDPQKCSQIRSTRRSRITYLPSHSTLSHSFHPIPSHPIPSYPIPSYPIHPCLLLDQIQQGGDQQYTKINSYFKSQDQKKLTKTKEAHYGHGPVRMSYGSKKGS